MLYSLGSVFVKPWADLNISGLWSGNQDKSSSSTGWGCLVDKAAQHIFTSNSEPNPFPPFPFLLYWKTFFPWAKRLINFSSWTVNALHQVFTYLCITYAIAKYWNFPLSVRCCTLYQARSNYALCCTDGLCGHLLTALLHINSTQHPVCTSESLLPVVHDLFTAWVYIYWYMSVTGCPLCLLFWNEHILCMKWFNEQHDYFRFEQNVIVIKT